MSKHLPTIVSPFQLPLDRNEFQVALQKGQGRALIHVMNHGASGFDQLILDACLHNQAYDPQCEGERADWLLEIMDAAGIQDAMQSQILGGWTASDVESCWDERQLCQLALAFARRGNPDFRSLLYASCRQYENTVDILAADEIIELDGADGLLFVAERAGQWIRDDPQTYVGNFPISFYDEKHGTGAAERVLRGAVDQNPLIATYLDHVDALEKASSLKRGQRKKNRDRLARFGTQKKSRFDKISSWSAHDIIEDVETTDPSANGNRALYLRWGSQASEQDLREVAERLFAEKTAKRTFLYLHVFLRCGLPDMDTRLLRYADSEDVGTRRAAYRVLANHEHPAVRNLAIDRVRAGRGKEGELLLLCRNYQHGDWSLIESALRSPEDQYELHSIIFDLLEVFRANRVKESFSPMMFVYEHSPCGMCRRNAVKALIDLGVAPDWVLKECRYDADKDTRKLGWAS